ncbi:hypothetical protein C0V75_13970 [Tabrizicola sp. TH137]|uniref:hypothetical protein n=1 Tax=Tabrizicola sp. TH137 TaxID=2067452 RepID=UPI000C7DA164|nr:hypothetical protein [Tabrizicola sp. TH137]PLL11994.1 hypothetical protein C0V75_13970 [Tabrizicola sp. TH137]
MWEAFLRVTEENPLFGFGLLFGGAAVLVWLGRALLMRFAPKWMVGPGGFLIDTRSRLGLFQMQDKALEHDRERRALHEQMGSPAEDRRRD